MSAEQRQKLGISDQLLRLSVGIEHPGDLRADMSQAMKKAAKAVSDNSVEV
jgi:cystathionine beta-lyase/cystathionine gamma-synthase